MGEKGKPKATMTRKIQATTNSTKPAGTAADACSGLARRGMGAIRRVAKLSHPKCYHLYTNTCKM